MLDLDLDAIYSQADNAYTDEQTRRADEQQAREKARQEADKTTLLSVCREIPQALIPYVSTTGKGAWLSLPDAIPIRLVQSNNSRYLVDQARLVAHTAHITWDYGGSYRGNDLLVAIGAAREQQQVYLKLRAERDEKRATMPERLPHWDALHFIAFLHFGDGPDDPPPVALEAVSHPNRIEAGVTFTNAKRTLQYAYELVMKSGATLPLTEAQYKRVVVWMRDDRHSINLMQQAPAYSPDDNAPDGPQDDVPF